MDNRTNIMDCAIRLFSSRGYDAVGIQEIVDQSGITKPTLYHYYKSKYGLLEAIFSDYFGRLLSAVSEVSVYQGDIRLTLKKITSAIFDFSKKYPEFYRMQLSMNFFPPENEANRIVRVHNERLFQHMAELFKLCVKDHGNMRGRENRYSASFIGLINTYIGLSLNGYVVLDDAVLQQALHQFMHGIFS